MKNALVLFFSILAISGCKDNFNPQNEARFCVKEGSHKFKPVILTSPDDVMEYEWQFDNCEYNLESADNCDWNKLTGVSYDFLNNHNTALMASWRYDQSDYFWVAPYYHFNSIAYWANTSCSDWTQSFQVDEELTAVKVLPNEKFKTRITINENSGFVDILIQNTTTQESTYFILDVGDEKPKREISPWFGGNREAPHTMCINRKTLN